MGSGIGSLQDIANTDRLLLNDVIILFIYSFQYN